MMRRATAFLAGILGLGLLSVAPSIGATYTGCWTCEYSSLTGMDGDCDLVGHQQHGEGTDCQQRLDPAGIYYCAFTGNACYHTDVGGGGGGGGGGGSSCAVRPGQGCPAECMSCEMVLF